MTTVFDSTRPCSSKSKQPGRYTRNELEVIAKSRKIKNVAKKNMDALCAELKGSPASVEAEAGPKSVATSTPALLISGKPCGTKFAKSGGYTRAELLAMAKKYKITNAAKKNMDVLCQDLHTKMVNPTTTTAPPPKTPTKSKAKTKTTDKPKPKAATKSKAYAKMIKMIHKKDPYAFSPNYTFNEAQKRWELIPGAPRAMYSFLTLKSKDDAELTEIMEKEYDVRLQKDMHRTHNDLIRLVLAYQNSKLILAKKMKDKSLEDIIGLVKRLHTPNGVQQIMNSYASSPSNMKRSVLIDLILAMDTEKLSQAQLKDLSQFVGQSQSQSVKSKDGSAPYFNVVQKLYPKEFRYIRSLNANKAVSSFTKKLIQHKMKKYPMKMQTSVVIPVAYGHYNRGRPGDIEVRSTEVRVSGYSHLATDSVANDITGLTKNKAWFRAQKAYQTSLSKVDQLLIFSYTYGGDQMYHSWLSGKFNPAKLMRSIVETYQHDSKYILPILPMLYKQYLTSPADFESFMTNNFKKTLSGGERSELVDLFAVPDALQRSNQAKIISWMIRNLPKAQPTFYDGIFTRYEVYLNNIIQAAPPTQEPLVVYKGLKGRDFIKFDKNNVFENEYFVSTSCSIAEAKRFAKANCCLMKITILKGTKCLFPVFTFYPNELEILFPTKRKFYLTKRAYHPGNDKYILTENVVVVN